MLVLAVCPMSSCTCSNHSREPHCRYVLVLPVSLLVLLHREAPANITNTADSFISDACMFLLSSNALRQCAFTRASAFLLSACATPPAGLS